MNLSYSSFRSLLVPFLGALSLLALFLNLPETQKLLGLGCKTCAASSPYLTLIGAGYFAVLTAVSLLFPAFPHPRTARSGLIFSVLLAIALTYVKFPEWCLFCLACHACHMLIWTIWMIVPGTKELSDSIFREKMCLIIFSPFSVIALFACLNLTFMAYSVQVSSKPLAGLAPGDSIPDFQMETLTGRFIGKTDGAQTENMIINFVSPDCQYCKEQLPIINAVAAEFASGPYRFINVSPSLPNELVQHYPATEWVEDKEIKLRQLFKVSGYPTMFVVGAEGKILQVIPGVPEQLETYLLSSLSSIEN